MLYVEEIMACKSIKKKPNIEGSIFSILIFVSVVLAALLCATAVSGLTIPANSSLVFDSIQDGNNNETNASFMAIRDVPCRPNGNEPEFIPNLLECQDYHICINGQSYDKNCADGHIFNIDVMKCTNTGRCLLDYQPICSRSGLYLPHVHECRHFFYCDPSEVDPILLACVPGQLFDQRSLRCVPEDQAICGNPPTDDGMENWPGK